MKSIFVRSLLVVAFLLGVVGMGKAVAGNDFRNETSTSSGYLTWDADMINVDQSTITGEGVYVAVLDTGLVPNWTDYFPKDRVNTSLGTGFDQPVAFNVSKDDPCKLGVSVGTLHETTWVGSTGSTHGTHVASTILGYFYQSPNDAVSGYALPPIMVRGIAPDVTIIPVKVLADYQIPATPKCDDPQPASHVVFGTDEMVAAGINYATDLAIAGYKPMVINMSLGGSELAEVEKTAIDRAVENGVIVVASAGNEGEAGMGYPGAYAPVISAGSAGWIKEWLYPDTDKERYRMFWLQYPDLPILPGTGDVPDPSSVDDMYLSDFSSRELPGQQLDVLAPGSWVRGPFEGTPGFAHIPWWAKGKGSLVGNNPGDFYYVGGTSMASPHVAGVAALMLELDPTLTAPQIEAIMKSSALPVPDSGSRYIYDGYGWVTITWDTDCGGTLCNPVGAGLLLADEALTAVP